MESKYSPGEIENKWYDHWQKSGSFQPKGSGDPYTIVIPPPNVTGALHLGHALNNTIQDILIRWQRKLGKNTLWIPGTDHAGIATQAVVEKRLFEEENKTRHDLGREALVERIWNWKHEYEERICGQLQKMGSSCDWSRRRFTLDPVCAKAVRHTFFHLFQKDLIYRGKRLVNWDSHLQTAVADDEIFYETVKGHMWTFKYPLADGSGYLPVATTRPETILGDTAVAVHPDDPRYKEYIGKNVKVPFVNREIPIIADGLLVDMDFGTGCVKVTPAHDPNDYQTGLRHNLEMINILTDDGKMNTEAGPFAGMKREACRKKLVEEMEAMELMIKIDPHEMQVGHSDRSKTAIEPYLSDQWFVAMSDLAQKAMDVVSNGKIQFFPQRFAKSYLDWLGEKRDWCISRQLWWGHQIPIWYAGDCPETDLQKAFAKRNDVIWKPIENGWLICSMEEDLSEDILGNGVLLKRDPDVLDTWFSSALWPHSTLGWPEQTDDLKTFYPTSVLVTSRDIISLWVARMVITGLENMGEIPFKHVYIHTTILDGQGQRMSKSKGNGVDPLDIIEKYGTDALRFTLAHMSTDNQDARMPVKKEKLEDGREINTSEKFELGRNFANKIWNAVRFVLPHAEGIKGSFDYEKLDLTEKWIVSKLHSLVGQTNEALEKYRFSEIAQLIYHFAWDDFCSRYLEIQKKTITSHESSPKKEQAIQVFLYVLDKLINIMHPVMPFITQEIASQLDEKASLINSPWPQVNNDFINKDIEESFEEIFAIVESIRSVRGAYSISPSQSLDIAIQLNGKENLGEAEHKVIHNLENLGDIKIAANMEKPKLSAASIFKGGQVFVKLEGILDLDAEIDKMKKELERAQGFCQSLKKKLGNKKFVDGAPATVVEKERIKLKTQEDKVKKLESAIAEFAD